MSSQLFGQFAAIGTAFCWTGTSLSFEAAGRRIGSIQVNLLRLLIAVGLFAVVGVVRTGSPVIQGAGAHAWVWLTVSGLVGFVIGDLFLFQAFVDVGARTAMVVYSSAPVLTALIGRIVLDERLSVVQILSMAATVAGIGIVSARPPGTVPRGGIERNPVHRVRGLVFALVGAVGQAAGLVLSQYAAPDIDPFGATQIRAIAGSVGFLAIATVTRRWRQVSRALHDRRAMRFVATGAFLGPFLGVSLGLFATQRAGTGVAATIIATVPVILIPVSLARGEEVPPIDVVGALLAVGGVAGLFLAV